MQAAAAVVAHATGRTRALLLGLVLCASALPARAVEIYRCPGQPAVYTSDLRLVRSNQCTKLGAAPAVRGDAVAPVSTGARARPATVSAAPQPAAVPRELQQQRDSDRVQILQSEQSRERERLAQLTQQQRSLELTGTDAARPEAQALAQAIRRSETIFRRSTRNWRELNVSARVGERSSRSLQIGGSGGRNAL